MRLTETEQSIYDACTEPKTAKALADELDINIRTIQGALGAMRKKGCLDMEKYKLNKSTSYTYRYTAKPIEKIVERKPYQLVGVQVFGVWL